MAARRRSSKRRLSASRKIDLILEKEDRVLAAERRIAAEEASEARTERKLESLEEQTLAEIKELERLETDIKRQIKSHPLKKIGARDLLRGIVGAFVGVMVHNALYYGTEIAEHLDGFRMVAWFVLALLIGGILLYATGYRKVEDKKALWILPMRLLILYTAALVVSATALFLYIPGYGLHMEESLRQLAAVQVSATIGAVTADMLGRD